jgi:hypothetical protein
MKYADHKYTLQVHHLGHSLGHPGNAPLPGITSDVEATQRRRFLLRDSFLRVPVFTTNISNVRYRGPITHSNWIWVLDSVNLISRNVVLIDAIWGRKGILYHGYIREFFVIFAKNAFSMGIKCHMSHPKMVRYESIFEGSTVFL